MANMSSYLEEKLLDMVFRNTAYTRPSVVYCGLINSSGTDLELEAGTLTNEVTTYTGDRKAITFSAAEQVLGKGTIKNSAALEFLLMPESIIKFLIISDAETAGNVLYWVQLTSNKNVNAGDTLRVPINELVLDLD